MLMGGVLFKKKENNEFKNIPVRLTLETKNELEKMSKETGIAQSDLVRLATASMLKNYEMQGSFIFADLLNPAHKEVKK